MTDPSAQLIVYLPGSCAQLVPEMQSEFAAVAPGVELIAGKIDQTGHLAEAIIAGAAVDIFISANLRYMEQVEDAGLVQDYRIFARNTLALFVRTDRLDSIRELNDLTREDVRTLVAPPGTDPGGAYTVELIDRAGLTEAFEDQKRRGNVIVMGTTNRPLPELIASGEIDAIILYRSIASRFPDFEVVALPPPLDMSDRIRFAAGAISRDGQSHPQADAFIDMLCGPAGQAMLARHNFLPPE